MFSRLKAIGVILVLYFVIVFWQFETIKISFNLVKTKFSSEYRSEVLKLAYSGDEAEIQSILL